MDLERQLGRSAAQVSVFRLKFQKLCKSIITARYYSELQSLQLGTFG